MQEIKGRQLNPSDGGRAYFLMIALFVFFSMLFPLVLVTIFGEQSFAYNLICLTFSAMAMVIVLIVYKNTTKQTLTTLLTIKKFNPIWLISALLLSVGMFCGLGFINQLFGSLLQSLGLNVSTADIKMDNVWQLICYILILAVVPAVVEEFFFRSLMFNSLKGCGKVTSILAVSLCFAIYHSNAVQLIYQFIFGVGLCLLTLKSGSVIPPIISHFINNFAIILLTYFGVNVNFYSLKIIFLGILCLTAFALTIAFINRQSTQEPNAKSLSKFYLPWGTTGMAVCLALAIGGLFL